MSFPSFSVRTSIFNNYEQFEFFITTTELFRTSSRSRYATHLLQSLNRAVVRSHWRLGVCKSNNNLKRPLLLSSVSPPNPSPPCWVFISGPAQCPPVTSRLESCHGLWRLISQRPFFQPSPPPPAPPLSSPSLSCPNSRHINTFKLYHDPQKFLIFTKNP